MKPKLHKSPENLFADLGRPDAEEAYLRARLLGQILAAVERMELTQGDLARLLGIKQPEASNLMRGKLSRFSLERLVAYLLALGGDVEVAVRWKKGRACGKPGVLRFAERRAGAAG